MKYQTHIKQLFDVKCLRCHGSTAPEYEQFNVEKDKWVKQGLGMKMDSYRQLANFVVWPNTGAVMRRLDDGKNMTRWKTRQHVSVLRRYREVEGEKSFTVQAVDKNWAWTKRLPELTKEEILELDKIRGRY